ncbi:hypothetical protein [Phytoactinopolyspora halotolerans]|uniref:Copper resistance protein D domain-containing protein n=1 Tax=Phytoactinopolyspora halotolerans TaxID=1981512 RepID=A0A6L9S859_9ACTN|nr:hypothetical protein [Phytoactinopolyspora halotolerans]NEE00160.1 hypothetical protein [Phytoactinopolyspora halotolerans]
MLWAVVWVVHLGLLAAWLGSMLYSLVIVQPRAHRFFAADDDRLEEFLTVVGSGNRRPVVALITGLFVSLAVIPIADTPRAPQAILYAVEGGLLVAAAVVFARVSWWLWPRRVFALAEERPRHRISLRRHAFAMVGLTGAAFVVAVTALTTAS